MGLTTLAGGTAGAAASGSPITVVMITSLTGEGSSEFSNAPAGFNARIALQDAQGGIDGHKISGVVVDDQTSPTEIATAVQVAVSKNPAGIVSTSPCSSWPTSTRSRPISPIRRSPSAPWQ